MSILGSLGATSLIWRGAEAPGGWNRSGKKPLYILCDWQWCCKGTLPVRNMWGEVGKTDSANIGLLVTWLMSGLLVNWHRLCKRQQWPVQPASPGLSSWGQLAKHALLRACRQSDPCLSWYGAWITVGGGKQSSSRCQKVFGCQYLR